MISEIKEILFNELDESTSTIEPLSGGDINLVYKGALKSQIVVIKINEKDSFPRMFEDEKLGLKLLSQSSFIIPEVLCVGETNKRSYIIMEYIKKDKPLNWELFGRNLALLHKISNPLFGLDHDNYIGSLKQINSFKKNWIEFYSENRILHLSEIALNKGILNYESCKKIESINKKLDSMIPKKKPSLVHGDLWSGNLIANSNGDPALIDPAVYFGHPDVDWAMLHLFGSPPYKAIEAYNEIYPIDSNWKESLEIHQLYPLLVHLILFGKGYYGSVMEIAKKYN